MLVCHHLLLLRDFGPYTIIYINVCIIISVVVAMLLEEPFNFCVLLCGNNDTETKYFTHS
jgi:hypothetical protein